MLPRNIERVTRLVTLGILQIYTESAFAQSSPALPPEKPAYDLNQVDVATGELALKADLVSIGEEGYRGLQYTEYYGTDTTWRDNYSGILYGSDDGLGNTYTTATFGSVIKHFFNGSPMDGGAESLLTGINVNGVLSDIFILKDGSQVIFRDPGLYYTGQAVFVTSVIYPDGTTLKFNYRSNDSNDRLQSITSNRGLQLKFSYASNSITSDASSLEPFFTRTNATAINNAYEFCDPFADTCSLTQPWPTGTMSIHSSPISFTNSAGEITQWSFTNDGQISIKDPSSQTFNTTYTTQRYSDYYSQQDQIIQKTRVTGMTREGHSWQYLYSSPPSLLVTQIDPLNKSVVYKHGLYQFTAGTLPLLESVTNGAGYTTEYSYNNYSEPEKYTLSEGNVFKNTFDTRKNINRQDSIPKPNSGLATVSITSIFPENCVEIKVCNFPTSISDGNRNTTSYMYNSAHGGIIKETSPSVNGVSLVKRHLYVQKFALIKNAGGSYSQTDSPVWVKSEDRECRTTTTVGNACAGGVLDEVVTTYDYGPASGPNNLLVRGVSVTTDGVTLRTCYNYDARGNKISETSPRAGLTACS